MLSKDQRKQIDALMAKRKGQNKLSPLPPEKNKNKERTSIFSNLEPVLSETRNERGGRKSFSEYRTESFMWVTMFKANKNQSRSQLEQHLDKKLISELKHEEDLRKSERKKKQ